MIGLVNRGQIEGKWGKGGREKGGEEVGFRVKETITGGSYIKRVKVGF
jgi:hypothetical protein